MTIKEFFEKYANVEFPKEQEKHIKEYLNIKDKKWKPEQDEKYYFVDSLGKIEFDTYYVTSLHDVFLYHSNNMFKTKEEAEFRLEQITVYNELKNFANDNNEEIDWSDSKQKKWFIKLDHNNSCFVTSYYFKLQHIGQIYFSSQRLAEQAIEKIGEDRIKKYLFGVE